MTRAILLAALILAVVLTGCATEQLQEFEDEKGADYEGLDCVERAEYWLGFAEDLRAKEGWSYDSEEVQDAVQWSTAYSNMAQSEVC